MTASWLHLSELDASLVDVVCVVARVQSVNSIQQTFLIYDDDDDINGNSRSSNVCVSLSNLRTTCDLQSLATPTGQYVQVYGKVLRQGGGPVRIDAQIIRKLGNTFDMKEYAKGLILAKNFMNNTDSNGATFRLRGLDLKFDASQYLVELASSVPSASLMSWLDQLIDLLTKRNLSSSIVDKSLVANVVQELRAQLSNDSHSEALFSVQNAFSLPKFIYSRSMKKFIEKEIDNDLFGNARTRSEVFWERYDLLLQRTSRHDVFSQVNLAAAATSKGQKYQLKTIEHLLAAGSKSEKVVLLGMLSQLHEAKYDLQDPTGVISLNLDNAIFHPGFYFENCFVLVEGQIDDGVFNVSGVGLPPPETAQNTRSYFGEINITGNPHDQSAKTKIRLKEIEEKSDDAFVFLSDVWLDDKKVMEHIEQLFDGFADQPPFAFIFCGNFLSRPTANLYINDLSDAFKNFTKLVGRYPDICERAHFVFVPGPQDRHAPKIYPRAPFPPTINDILKKRIRHLHLATNPVRIQYCTQEIVIFREDLLQKLCRYCIKLPSDNLPMHLCHTLVAQAHLSPLPVYMTPVYWSYDHALHLYPLPDLVVICDKFKSITDTIADCTIINPGSFAINKYCFKVYLPGTREVEDSQITNISNEIMMTNTRPSLDILVPLVMVDEDTTNDENMESLSYEPEKEIFRHFESGDIVLVRLDTQCFPAIVFNISGLVMKFDIDRQLYHVCLFDKEFTEKWIDAADMISYSVPMVAEGDNEQLMLMWTVANELLDISNDSEEKCRLEEFRKRFKEVRRQEEPVLSMNTSRNNRRTRSSVSKATSQQIVISPLTTCEGLYIIDTIYRLSPCKYADAKRLAEETYTKIICTNNRENVQTCPVELASDQWFSTFAIEHAPYFRQYSSSWLPELEEMLDKSENNHDLLSLISLMKESA
ncbi:unnamed protein product [Adineta ricciae]|uniref:DNA polymerase II subunit 2 n=1 Tax=Adineta ricciae TaxID=249248 RepID=A0A816AYN4_ADIRI|nr:unnamed protein product [Adineta ricciae]